LGLFYLDLVEPEAMKDRLNAVSMDNWMHCIDEALRKSGYTRKDIGYLNVLHMKRSAHLDMLQHLGLTEEQSVYLSDYGHLGQQDTMLSIAEGLKQGRLKDGDLMVIVAAGIGYAWGAACVKWGPCTT
jgi:3-oxoacyl-[acyl-carrier-protein] synthase-3